MPWCMPGVVVGHVCQEPGPRHGSSRGPVGPGVLGAAACLWVFWFWIWVIVSPFTRVTHEGRDKLVQDWAVQLLGVVTEDCGGDAGTAFQRLARPLQTWRFAIRPKKVNHAAVIYLQESHVDPLETKMSALATGRERICYSLLPCWKVSELKGN